jgi:hypothetical protein
MDVKKLSEAIFRALEPWNLTLCYFSATSPKALEKEWPQIKKRILRLKPRKGSKIILFVVVNDDPIDWVKASRRWKLWRTPKEEEIDEDYLLDSIEEP